MIELVDSSQSSYGLQNLQVNPCVKSLVNKGSTVVFSTESDFAWSYSVPLKGDSNDVRKFAIQIIPRPGFHHKITIVCIDTSESLETV